MAGTQLHPTLRYVRQLFASRGARDQSDRHLLQQYTADHDEAAFAALLRRHAPLVWGVCRNMLGHEQDAEDAFQATFLVLARRGASVRDGEALASYLHGVAYRTALRARRDAARRRLHERRAGDVPPRTTCGDLALRELQAVLDEEVRRLPEKYRAPFVLCCLEGKTKTEAAQELGWKEGTVSGRLARARRRLQRALTRRGVTLAAALAAVAISAGTAAAALPPGLAATTTRVALRTTAGSARVLALAEGASGVLSAAPIKTVAALVLALGLLAGAAGLIARQTRAPEAPPPKPMAGAAERPKPPDAKPLLDRYGDPLPPGALARLGTVRWRHGGRVESVAFAPDGKTLAAAGVEPVIHLRDAFTGKSLRTFRGHTDRVSCVRFTPDGKTLVSMGDRMIRVWDVASGKERRSWKVLGGWTFALSPDGKSVAALATNNPVFTAYQWDLATGATLREFPCDGDQDGAMALAFSPDGKRLASGGDRALRVWDVATGKQLRLFGQGHGQTGTDGLAFSPDGKTLAVGSHDPAVRLWEVATGKEVRRIPTQTVRVDSLRFSPDGKHLAAGCGDTVRLWDPRTGKEQQVLKGPHYDRIWGVTFSRDGKALAMAGECSRVRVWDLSTGKERGSSAGHQDAVRLAALLPGGKEILSVGQDSSVRVWDAASAREVRRFGLGEQAWCYCAALSPDGRSLAAGDWQAIHLLDWASGKEVRRLKGHARQTFAVAYFPDGRTLASVAHLDRSIRLWDVQTGKELRQIRTRHQNGPISLAVSPDGRTLATGGEYDQTICLWDATPRGEGNAPRGVGSDIAPHTPRPLSPSGKLLRQWPACGPGGRYRQGVGSIAFSPDGESLATSGADRVVRLWDPATGRQRCQFPGGGRLTFSPDGKTLASSEPDNTIRLWEVLTGRERLRFVGHTGFVMGMTFTADGRKLISASSDTTALVWDVWGGLPAARGLDALWDDLAGGDAARAYRALRTLRAAPRSALPLLNRLRPATPPDPERVARLLRDLDSERFAVRQSAAAGLEKLGELAGPALRRARERSASLEARRRLDQLLEKLDAPATLPEQLRALRSVELLEQLGGPEADKLLRALAGGTAEARLTREAKRSLRRLGGRQSRRP